MLDHRIKYSLLPDQLVRLALLNYVPLLHHKYLIIICHCIQPMSHRYDCGISELLPEDLLDEDVTVGVQI